MRNVPISRNAITVNAVMAFFFAAATAEAAEIERSMIDYGTARQCGPTEFGARLGPADPGDRLLATYFEYGILTTRVRILQQGKKFLVESELADGTQKVFNGRRSLHPIDAKLAARISSQLARDLSRDAFVQESNDPQAEGARYLFTADGKTCAVVPEASMNARARDWAKVLSSLYGGTPQGEVKARYLFSKLEQKPQETLPPMPAWNSPKP